MAASTSAQNAGHALDQITMYIPVHRAISIKKKYRHTSFYCILQILFFRKLKVHGDHARSKHAGAVFPAALAYFVSLCHIWVIVTTIHTFALFQLWRQSVIGDLRCCWGKTLHWLKLQNFRAAVINVFKELRKPWSKN